MSDYLATPLDRMALAMCNANSDIGPCNKACFDCREQAAAASHELAEILRERYGYSDTAEWLDELSRNA